MDLLNSTGEIDTSRYPNFGELQNHSTWYSNATTVWYETMRSVPAILTGNRVRLGLLPITSDYPNNIFSILQPHYSLHIHESATAIEPNREMEEKPSIKKLHSMLKDMAIVFMHILLPEKFIEGLPPINNQWGGFAQNEEKSPAVFGDYERSAISDTLVKDIHDNLQEKMRKVVFDSFVNSMSEYPDKSFHFIHTLLPHRPDRYLPSGKTYTPEGLGLGCRLEKKDLTWVGPTEAIERAHQGHLLQIAFVDKLLGELVAKMKSMNIYDESLLVIVADHGASYQPGISSRRPFRENFGEIGFVPMIIKQPGQRIGKQDTSNVETVDVVPTMLDILGAKVDLSFDGRSLINPDAPIPLLKNLPTPQSVPIEYTEDQYLEAKKQALARNVDKFSLDDPRANLFHFGVALDLVNRPLSDLQFEQLSGEIHCKNLDSLQKINQNSRHIPTRLVGHIENMKLDDLTFACVVASVNGIVQGASRPYIHKGEVVFDFILSDSVLEHGENNVELQLLKVKA